MDDVDKKQQEEIISLQKKDVAHDNDITWMRAAIKFSFFTFIIYVMASMSIIFVLLDKLDKFFKP